MLSVVMLNVAMLSVVSPNFQLQFKNFILRFSNLNINPLYRSHLFASNIRNFWDPCLDPNKLG
jgi:hypothetical protein